MLLRLKTLYIYIKDADAVYIAFLRVTALQLLPYADAQDGLFQVFYHLIQFVCL